MPPPSIAFRQRRRDASAPARNSVLTALVGASCLTAMAATAITPALPGMAEAFAETPNGAFLVKIALTLPALIIALLAPFIGALVDRLGAGRILVVSALIFAIAGSVGLYAPDLSTLLVSRAALGAAIAGMSTASLTLVGALYANEQRQRVIGLQGSAASFGGMLFLLLGGLLAAWGWRLPFAVYLLALALIPIALGYLPRSSSPVAVSPSGEQAETTRWRPLILAYASAFLGMALFYVIPVQLPFHLASNGAVAPRLAGYALSLCTFSGGVTAAFYSRIRSRHAAATIIAAAFAMIAAGQICVAFGDYRLVLLGMAIAGCSAGLLLPTVSGLVLASAPAHRRGRFTGFATASLFLGQFASPLSAEIAEHLAGNIFVGVSLAAAATCLAVIASSLFISPARPRR